MRQNEYLWSKGLMILNKSVNLFLAQIFYNILVDGLVIFFFVSLQGILEFYQNLL